MPTFRFMNNETGEQFDDFLSNSRREELLVEKSVLNKMWILRRILTPMNSLESVEFLIGKLKNTKSNSIFFESMNSL